MAFPMDFPMDFPVFTVAPTLVPWSTIARGVAELCQVPGPLPGSPAGGRGGLVPGADRETGKIPKNRWFFEENLWKILWNSVITSYPARNLNIFWYVGLAEDLTYSKKWSRMMISSRKPCILRSKNADVASWGCKVDGCRKGNRQRDGPGGGDWMASSHNSFIWWQYTSIIRVIYLDTDDLYLFIHIHIQSYTWVGWWCWCLTVSMLIVIWSTELRDILTSWVFWELLPVWRWNYFWPVWCWCGSPDPGKEFSLGQSWHSTLEQPDFQPWHGCFRFLITFCACFSFHEK